jgi:hypothetical protein
VDARAARPAGAVWTRGGALYRVAQDCATHYGAALTIARIDRLDTEGFAQTVVARLPPRTDWRARHAAIGTHTLNQGGGFEAIDIRTKSWRRLF